MAERKRIALNFQVGYDFAAGLVIYMQNILKGLNLLDDDLKPHVTIIYSKYSSLSEIKNINYPYIKYYLYNPVKYNIIVRGINKVFRILFNINLIKRYSFPSDVDLIYPFFNTDDTFFIKKRIYWKPDFQELYFPNYISKNEIEYSSGLMKSIAAGTDYTLVLSSEDAFDDFKRFYSPYVNKIKILKFISLLPDFSAKDKNAVLRKYNITKKYFMIANQFWPHKNHMLALEALNELIKDNYDIILVLTGKKSSYRDKKYFIRLEKFIYENDLRDRVKMTGLISREDQLVIMKNAEAVIQPSLFEGWSTVIEDCKAMGQFVIASDLKVNQEQLKHNGVFFSRTNASELAARMRDRLEDKKQIIPEDYQINIARFKNHLIDVLELK